HSHSPPYVFFFLFHASATTAIYTLSLHDALPICPRSCGGGRGLPHFRGTVSTCSPLNGLRYRGPRRTNVIDSNIMPTIFRCVARSEEHTSELQSRENLVCRLLLEKKKNRKKATDR